MVEVGNEQALSISIDVPEQGPSNIREFFSQEPLPLDQEQMVEKMDSFLSKVTLDNYSEVVDQFDEWIAEMHQELTPHFEKRVPEGVPSESHLKRRERRLRLRHHYHQEIRNGVEAMIKLERRLMVSALEDKGTAVRLSGTPFIPQLEATSKKLIDSLFECRDEKFVPKDDLTNEQSFLILAAGLSYLLDHEILLQAKAEYGDDAVRVADGLYKVQLKHPNKAEVVWQDDVGVVLVVDSEDMSLFSFQNPYGIYLRASALNNQLMVVKRKPEGESARGWRSGIINHERDHLFFYRYRTIKDRLKEQPDNQETRRRLISDPFATELIIGHREMRNIKALIASEVSAYALEGRIHMANFSVELQKRWHASVKTNEDTGFFKPLSDFESIYKRLIYPLIKEEMFIKFYHTMDMCCQAIDHGVPARKVSVALAFLGPDRIRHLKALDPQLKVFQYVTNLPKGFLGIIPPAPFYYSYISRYGPYYQRLAGSILTIFPDLKKRMARFWGEDEFEKLYLGRGLAEERFPFTKKKYKDCYILDGPEPGELDLSTFKSRVISAARIVFPELSEDFFNDAFHAQTPFHPVFKEEESVGTWMQNFAAQISRMVKEVAIKGDKFVEKATDRLLTPHQKDGGNFEIVEGKLWEAGYFPFLWAVSNYPEDAKLLTKVVRDLLPATLELFTHEPYTTRDGYVISEGAGWRCYYLGFFYDYRQIRQDRSLDEQGKKQAIDKLVSTWKRFLEQQAAE